MTLDMGDTTKLNVYRQEAERLGIRVLPPDVNRSKAVFAVEQGEDGKPAIRYALGAIRNVGRAAMERVAAARAEGPFKTLFDFARRVDSRLVNKRALENLAAAGAFDCIVPNRAQVTAAAELMIAHSDSEQRERESGQSSLFGGGSDVKDPKLPLKAVWDSSERLQREFEAIGFYLSGHPLDEYAVPLRRLGVKTWAQVSASGKSDGGAVQLAGIILDRKDKQAREGGRPYSFIRLSDQTAVFETTVFSELLTANDDLLRPGAAVVFTVTIDWEEETARLRTHGVKSLDDAAKSASAGLRITAESARAMPPLRSVLETRKGKGRVSLALNLEEGRTVEIDIGRYAVTPDLRRAIRTLPGVVEVEEV